MKAICAIIKDEHLFLEEWIEWHFNIGFDVIHLYEDKGSESHEDICSKYDNVYLRRYEDDVEVQNLLEAQGSSTRQLVLYDWFAREYADTYNWVAFIDLDEFVVFSNEYNLEKLCKEFEPYPAVLLNWRIMGANRHVHRAESVVNAYTKEAVMLENFECIWWHKSVVNLKRYKGLDNLHRAVGAVNTSHEDNHLQLCYDKAWLNHYFTKSWEDWCDRIFKRGGTLTGHRTLTDFFQCNADMLPMKDELVSSVDERIPNGTYWLDKKKNIIAGGNMKKIADLCRPRNHKLIFDLGSHNGDTFVNFLREGHKVVGVECNPELVSECKKKFCTLLLNGSLRLIDNCITDADGQDVKFYLSTHPVWSSCNKNIAEREEESREIVVKSITLKTLIDIYGCPDYCKIDIEGNDIIALHSIINTNYRPAVISCESQCYGKGENGSGLEVLDKLKELGYNQYMLINQMDNSHFRFDFDACYQWISYDEIRNKILGMKQEKYGIWADIYATYK